MEKKRQFCRRCLERVETYMTEEKQDGFGVRFFHYCLDRNICDENIAKAEEKRKHL